ncbi:MAG: hypothetical protein P4L71_12655 [Acetobacteraceae bacterium]|nr:hypothetical protein [Acetobacteraceae bacterium]
MTPKFLREEAVRFRDMAETSGREASRLRLLGMAADFEARAKIAEEATGSKPDEPTKAKAEKKSLGL